MTARVRIEHAEARAAADLVVQVWTKPLAPSGVDVLLHEFVMTTPADMREIFVDSSRYVVIRERIKA